MQRFIILIIFFVFTIQTQVLPARSDGRLHLFFLDVGQGDSIFIITPKRQQFLIDGGPDLSVLYQISDLMPFFDRRLEGVINTHPHYDHLEGLIEVVKRYQIKQVWAKYLSDESAGNLSAHSRFFRDQLEELESAPQPLWQGQTLELEPGVYLDVCWPPQASLSDPSFLTDPNAYSLVLVLRYGDFTALLTSDFELGNQPKHSLGECAKSLEKGVSVLKVPHQGSQDALDQVWLQWLKPKLALISVGGNSYGHPAPTTLNLLEKNRINIWRTDLDGRLHIRI